MINFRGTDLDAMVAQLRDAGITVDVTGDIPQRPLRPSRRPEGDRIELWEPAGQDLTPQG